MEAIKFYKRIVYKDIPIYINPEKPDWFVPTQSTDELLRMLKGQKTIDEIVSEYSKIFAKGNCHILQEIRHFLQRIQIGVSSEFKGRSHYKRITSLKECWFHITNQCNMACTHCMFASNPTTHRHLEFDDLLTSIYQASSLGCKVFYFTGGEPCVYKGFTAICDEILRQKDVHIIILTNGRNIFQFDEWLKSAPTERTHFQLSIDGLEKNHDTIRGKGSFQQLIDSVTYLKNLRFPITLVVLYGPKT